jgi:hypothetical protein
VHRAGQRHAQARLDRLDLVLIDVLARAPRLGPRRRRPAAQVSADADAAAAAGAGPGEVSAATQARYAASTAAAGQATISGTSCGCSSRIRAASAGQRRDAVLTSSGIPRGLDRAPQR